MFGYAAYADRFAGDLARRRASSSTTSTTSASTYLHLMPLLQPRDGRQRRRLRRADYRAVRPDLGTIDDLRDAGHRRCASTASAWCSTWCSTTSPASTSGRSGRGPATRRTATTSTSSPTATCPTRYERDPARGVPGLRAGQLHLGRRPRRLGLDDVQRLAVGPQLGEPRRAVRVRRRSSCDLANLGVEVLRLDAIAFLWKRMGTTCQNQPEVHALTQALRTVARIACPGGGVQGRGDRRAARPACTTSAPGAHAGKVSDLAYHNSLMVQVWSMLATRDARLAAHALQHAAAGAVDRHLDHLRALPRRHRLGDRRRATPPRSG